MTRRAAALVGTWFVAICCAVMPPGSSARPLDEVLASRELRVIVYGDNEPFSWLDGETARGFDVDLAMRLAAKLEVEAKFEFRVQGERVDQDLRTNLLRGTFGGGAIGDVMMSVPHDREYLYGRVAEVFVANPYFMQRVALGVRADRAGDIQDFGVFRTEKIVVQLGTVADYFLMRFDGGALAPNVVHYVWPNQGAQKFEAEGATAILGVQSHLEPLLSRHRPGLELKWSVPRMDGISRASWPLGMGFASRSRDLAYAMDNALRELAADGELAGLAKKYGMTYVPP